MSAPDFGDQIQSEKLSEIKLSLVKCTNMTYILQIECTQNMAFFGKSAVTLFCYYTDENILDNPTIVSKTFPGFSAVGQQNCLL